MSSFKYIVPALAIAGRAIAETTNSCSVSATTTIASAADASALSGCSTFTGTIALATGASGNIALDGIKVIEGSLVADNATGVTALSASSLLSISDDFSLTSLTILSSLSFPQLTDVGSIIWNALPALQGLSFTTGVQSANELNIQNTQLSSLDGINLQVVDTVTIVNNNYLEDIEMQLGNVTTSLSIEANGNNVSAIFPNMIWANNMTFRNVSVVSIPSLAAVNGSLGFYSNDFTNLTAANLTSVGGSLSFVSNTELTNITMPQLTTVGGGFSISNNTELDIVTGFPKLKTIAGALDMSGNFTDVELPALGDVRGAFNLQSSADITDDCSTFSKLKSSSVIKGKYVCAGTVAKPSGVGSNPSSTGSSSSSSSTASGAASGLYIPGTTGLMGVVAVLFGLM